MSPMPACPRCGHENPKGSQFCNACAEPLTPAAAASGGALKAALQRDRTDEAALDLLAEPASGPDRGGTYVRWEGFPWSPMSTIEQTYGQFVFTSILLFVVIAIMFLALAYAGQAVCGGLLALVMGVIWFVRWQVGQG